MANSSSLTFNIFGKDVTGSKALNGVGTASEKLAKKLGDLGATVTKTVTLPLVAVGAAGAAAAIEVDKGLDEVAARTGVTGAALDGLHDTFRAVASGATQGMEEVGKTVGEVNTRLGLTGQPLEEVSGKILDLARISGIDATDAAMSLTRAMNDWGIAAADSGQFMDVLLKASQATGIGVDALSDKLVKFGSPMRQLGFSSTQTAAMLGSFEKAGVNTDLVMGSLRIGLGKLAKAGETDLPAALQKSILEIKNAESGGAAAAKAMELFGSRAGADMAAAIREGKFEVADLAKQLANSQGALASTTEATDGFEEQWARTQNQLKLAGESIGTALMPMLQAGGDAVGRFARWFSDLSPAVKNTIMVIVGIAAAVGPMLIVISKVILAVTAMSKAFAVIKGVLIAARVAMWAFNLSMLANPIGLVIAAVVAVIAIIVVLWNKCDWFRNAVMVVWEAIKTAVGAVVGWFQNSVVPWLQAAWDAIVIGLKVLWAVVSTVWNAVWTVIKTVVGWIRTYIVTYFTAVWAVISTVWNAIAAVISTVVGWIRTYVTAYFTAVKIVVTAIWNAISSVVSTVWNVIKGVIQTVVGWIRTYVTAYFRAVQLVISTVWNAIKTVIGTVVGWIQTYISTSFTVIKAVITTIWNAVRTVFMTVWNAIKTVVGTVVDWIRSTIVDRFNQIKNVATVVWNTIRNVIANAIMRAREILGTIKGAIDNVIGWFKALPGRIGAFIGGVADKIKAPFVTAFNYVRDLWNSTIGKLSWTVPDWIPVMGGKTVSAPRLASGGTVLPRSGGTLAILAEAGRAESVVDTGLLNQRLADLALVKQQSGALGGPRTVTVNAPVNVTINGATDPVRTAQELRKVLLEYKRTTGVQLGLE